MTLKRVCYKCTSARCVRSSVVTCIQDLRTNIVMHSWPPVTWSSPRGCRPASLINALAIICTSPAHRLEIVQRAGSTAPAMKILYRVEYIVDMKCLQSSERFHSLTYGYNFTVPPSSSANQTLKARSMTLHISVTRLTIPARIDMADKDGSGSSPAAEIGEATAQPFFGVSITTQEAKQLSTSGKDAQERRKKESARPLTPPRQYKSDVK